MTKRQRAVYDQYHRLVFHVAICMIERFSLPPDIKDDVAQHGFLGMFRAIENGYRVTPALIRTCINNGMRDAIKKERRYRHRYIPMEETTPSGDSGQTIDEIDNRLDAQKRLSALPPEQQQIVLMLNEGYTIKEVTKLLNLKKESLALLQEYL